jgi:hypothetical protein
VLWSNIWNQRDTESCMQYRSSTTHSLDSSLRLSLPLPLPPFSLGACATPLSPPSLPHSPNYIGEVAMLCSLLPSTTTAETTSTRLAVVLRRRRFQHGMTASVADHTNTRTIDEGNRAKSKNLPFHKRYWRNSASDDRGHATLNPTWLPITTRLWEKSAKKNTWAS